MNSSVSQLESEVVEITFRFARFVSRNIKLNYTIEQITILVEMNVIMSQSFYLRTREDVTEAR